MTKGHWESPPKVNIGKRVIVGVAIILGIILVALLLAQTAAQGAEPERQAPSTPNVPGLTAAKDTVRYYDAKGNQVSRAVAVAGAGCSSRSRRWTSQASAVWWKATGSGCWNAANTKVTSYKLGAEGDGIVGYQYLGIVSRVTLSGIGGHIAEQRITGRFDFCLPFAGCTQVWRPWAQFALDSYGNWNLRP